MTAMSRESAVLQAALAVIVALSIQALVLGGDSPEDTPEATLRSLMAGNGLLNRGLYESAIDEYRSFLSGHEDHEKASVARYGMAVSLFRLERFDEAAREAAPLRKLEDFVYAAEAGVIEGQCHLERGRYAEAAEAFDDVARRFGNHEMADDALLGAAEALYRAGKYEESAKRSEELGSRHSESPLRDRSEYFWAMSDMAGGNFGSAADRFETMVRSFPKSPLAGQASLLAAQCNQRGDSGDKAKKQYEKVIRKGDERFVPDALLGLGTLLFQDGKYEQAEKALNDLVTRFPHSPLVPQALLQRAHARFSLGAYDQALESFREAGEADKEVAAETTYWMAKCEFRSQEFSSAAKRLASAIERFPDSPLLAEMNYDRAVALLRAGDADRAVEALSEFTSRFTDHALASEALQLLAMTEHQQGHFNKSLTHSKAYLKQYPSQASSAAVAFLAAENEFLLGNHAEAARAFEDFIRHFGDDPQADKARLRMATALYRLERFDEAETVFEQIASMAEKDELFRPALLALGDIAFQRGEWKKAATHLSKYLSGSGELPSADDALMKLAYAEQQQERNDQALRDYERLIEQFPKSAHRVQAFFERGQILVALKRVDDARQCFERVLAEGIDSRFALHSLNYLASIAMQRNDTASAASLYERAAKSLDGGEGESGAVLRQGQALLAGEQHAQAEAAFRRVVELDADKNSVIEARAGLAIAISRQGRHADALAVIDEIERQPDRDRGLEKSLRTALGYEKAWCLRALDKSEDAVKAYRDVLANADAGSIRWHAMLEMAELESAAKRFDSAAVTLRDLREKLSKDALPPQDVREQCLYRLGICEFELGRFDETVNSLEELISAFPRSELISSASYYAGESLFRAGRNEKAIAHLTRAAKEGSPDSIAAAALLRLGECHAVLQRWALSEQVFQDYLDRFRDREQWFQALFGVGWARENQKRFDSAIEAYKGVVERHQGPTAARAQFQIGQCLFAQKQFEPAARELLKVDILYAYPEWSAAALYEAGRCFVQLGDPAQARRQFSAVTETYKDSKWANLAGKEISQLSAAVSLPGQ